MAKKFPDLTGDGKVTQADVLKGRGVFVSGSEVDGYASLLNQFELSESKAETKKELEQVKKRREAYIGDLESNADLQRAFDAKYKRVLIKNEDGSSRYYHVPREDMAMGGSLMMPLEREAYGKGKLVDKLIRALSKRQSDEIPETLGQQVDDGIVWKPEGEKVVKKDIERAKEAIRIPPKGRKIYERPFIPRPYFSMAEGRSGTHVLLQEDIPEGSEAFRQKFVTTWRRGGKHFTHNGEKYIIAKGESERVEKNMGSLMVAPEREAYGKGKLIKRALKALDGDDAPKPEGKIKTTEGGVKIDTEIQEEVRQFIGKLKTVDAEDRKYNKDALTAQDMEDYLYDFINEVPPKGFDGKPREPDLHTYGRPGGYDLTSRFEFFGALDDAVESMVEGNSGPVLDKKSRQKLINRMFMEGQRELEAEEKVAKAKRKAARKERRAEARRAKENEGSLMMPSEREQKGKGKLIKEAAPKIVDIFERLVGPKTVAKKKQMVSEEQALREIQKTVDKDPQALEMLSDEDYVEVVSRLPQQQRANFGLDDVPVDDPDDILQMLMDMEPEEAAQNLQLFPSMEAVFEYASSLNAKDARKFMNALSPEDKEIFAGELPEFDLGPREVKGHGGSSGVAILMPAEYEEPPKDTYNNVSTEEEKEEVENMNSDGEMEEEYINYVADEVLSQEEQDYLFKTLDKDDKLEKILDKVMLNATEFTGAGEVDGPGTGVSDSIPARLSDGEFVFTKKATDQLGADKLQKMMDDAEREFDQRKGKANGGQAGTNPFVNPEETSNPLDRFEMDKDNEKDIERQMLYSSRMPSLMNR
jgi:hypothetical protein